MPGFAPSGELSAIADAVCAHADTLRTIAARLTRVAATTRWQSSAASAFRARAHDAALALRAGAGRLDDAAEAVRRHAAAVDAARAGSGR